MSREVEILKKISHNNCIPLLDFFYTQRDDKIQIQVSDFEPYILEYGFSLLHLHFGGLDKETCSFGS